MIVGFTGTRRGLSERQRLRLIALLVFARSGPGEFHHGDCIGADAQAHAIALAAGWDVVIHPPRNPSLRAWCAGRAVSVLDPLPYLDRNRAIVDVCAFLIAAPFDLDQAGGGTLFTIGYARRVGRPLEILPR